MRLAEIELELKVVEGRRQSLLAAKAKALGRKLVTCTRSVLGKGCGRKFQIRTLTYIQTNWYTRPHGCTGGDYWNPGEGQFDCPKCGNLNRLYDRPEIEKLKPYFKNVEIVYDED